MGFCVYLLSSLIHKVLNKYCFFTQLPFSRPKLWYGKFGIFILLCIIEEAMDGVIKTQKEELRNGLLPLSSSSCDFAGEHLSSRSFCFLKCKLRGLDS